MQVLIEYAESRKVIVVEKISDIVQKAKECFEIKGNVVVQKYDNEWMEYIDCNNDIVSGDKLKIIVKSKRSVEGQDKLLVSNLILCAG